MGSGGGPGQPPQLPVPATFQFDSSAIGNGVNLFRGDLAFSMPLVSLPCRGGLTADIVAFYESRAHLDVGTWNVEAPTDVLGLGWSLPFERVFLDSSTAMLSAASRSYLLDHQGQTAKLVAVPTRWTRAVLPGKTAARVSDGRPDPAVVAEFAARGRPLSDRAMLHRHGEHGWRLEDAGTRRTYLLEPQSDGSMVALTGGRGFEMAGFQFWQIVYYETYETWEIVKDDGVTWLYGEGDDAGTNTIQWGIAWDRWIGASARAENQRRYPTAWNLARIENPAGNGASFEYAAVEQAVGEGTLTYTKECHVTRVNSDLGWAAVLHYEPKRYDTASLDAPKEYLDPHHDPETHPDTSPDAFQSRYSTQYLDRIDIVDEEGSVRSWLAFDYHDLTNLTARDPHNLLGYGATYKRYLKSVTQHFADGEAVPGVEFDYVFDPESDQPLGALRHVLYPGGGTTTVSYRQIEVGADADRDPGARNRTITNPFGDAPGSFRTWYGPDYLVCAWWVFGEPELRINVYTWTGRWSPGWSDWFALPIAPDGSFDDVQVATAASTLLVSVGDSSAATSAVYLFHRDPRAAARWRPWSDADGPIAHAYATASPALAGGDDFFLVVDSDAAVVDRYSWNWHRRAWQLDHLGAAEPPEGGPLPRYEVTARGPYHLVLRYEPSTGSSLLSLSYRDELLEWQPGGSLETSKIHAPVIDGVSYLQLAPGDGMVAVASVTGRGDETFDFEVHVLSWDGVYDHLEFESLPVNRFENVPAPILASLGPTMVDDTVVGCGPELFRFDGVDWTHESLGVHFRPSSTPADDYYWYGYAPDAAVRTENTASGIYATLTATDPGEPAGTWTSWVLEERSQPVPGRFTMAFPTLTAGALTQGPRVFNRSVLPAWVDPTGLELGSLERAGVDTTTMLDEPPHFLAFMTVDEDDDALATHVAFYRNGNLVRDATGDIVVETFDGQQMFRFLDRSHRAVASLGGKLPAVPDGFTTFPTGETVDSATEMTMHRYVDGSVQRPISASVVAEIATQSGYGAHRKCYEYADVSAAADPTGTIIRFQTVEEYEGCSRPADQEHGWTTSHFFNGLPPDSEGLVRFDTQPAATEGYSLLDGMLVRRDLFDTDGRLVASTENTWQVVDEVATDPGGSSRRPLYGGVVQVAATTVVQDGLSRTTAYEYSLASGSPTAITRSYYASHGTLVTRRQEMEYAFEVYPEMWTRWLLKPVACSTVRAREGTGSWELQSIEVQTNRAWTTAAGLTYWAELDSWVPAAADAPPFTWWDGGTPPPTWVRRRHVAERGAYGEVVRSVDVQGREARVLFDGQSRFPVASFVAGGAGASYHGFERYEPPAWDLASGDGRLVSSDSSTGARCFEIRCPATLVRTVSIDAAATQVFGGWVRTPRDRDDVEVRFRMVAPGSGRSVEHAVPPTDGEWAAVQWVVDPGALGLTGTAPVDLEVVAVSGSGSDPDGWARVDDLFLTRLESTFSADVYEVPRLRKTATVGFNGNCERLLYNLEERAAVRVGVGEHVAAIATTFDVRQAVPLEPATAAESFPRSAPNFRVAVAGRDTGFYDEFKDGALARYETVDSGGGTWTLGNRSLRFDGASPSLLGARVRREAFETDSVAVYVLVEASAGDAVSVGTGSAFVVWDGTAWQLVVDDGGTLRTIATDCCVPFDREWLMVVADGRVLFFAGGARVFSVSSAVLDGARHGAELGLRQAGGFHTLAVASDVSVALDYQDGLRRRIQTRALEGGDTALVGATLRDTLGRAAISVKSSRVTTAETEDPLGFSEGFVTDGGPDGAVWAGAPMTGSVVGHHPDDGGYPFSRKVYEASPLGRVVATGRPGFAFAVRPGNPHVATTGYGVNADPGPFLWPLPVGEYFVLLATDADGVVTERWFDSEKHVIGTVVRPTSGQGEWRTSFGNDMLGRPVATIPPSAYASAAVRPAGEAVALPSGATIATYDFMGRRTSVTAPDQGATECVFDTAGLPRFLLDERGRAGGYFIYRKYDALNRPVELGIYRGEWDRPWLEQKADDRSWPATGTWTTRSVYDGDATTPHTVGRLWQSQADVTDTFSYDAAGRVVGRRRGDWEISHGYDAAGNLVWSGDSLTGAVTRREYDRMGRLHSVSEGGADRLRLTYTQTGALATAAAPSSQGGGVERTYAYNPVGWMTAVEDDAMAERLDYTTGGCDGDGHWTGVVSHQRVEYELGAVSGEDTCFGVDYLGRIDRAGPDTWSMDDNGNVSRATVGGAVTTYAYDSGLNNRLVSVAGALDRAYAYDEVGAVRSITSGGPSSGETSFVYGEANHLVRTIETGGESPTSITFAYDGAGGVAEQVTAGAQDATSTRLSSFADGDLTLDVHESGSGVPRVARTISAPGVVLTSYEGADFTGLTDHLGSLRLLLAADGSVAGQWDYGLHGETTVVAPPPFPVFRLYTGQRYEPTSGLYHCGARLYDPSIARFLATDPLLEGPSPYVYVGGNPLVAIDPDGQAAWWAILAGVAVGAAVTLLTGGIGGALLGGGAAVADVVGMAAGVAGSVAGDATTAGLAHEKFTWQRAVTDLAAGAIGGAVGGAVGGGVGSAVARSAAARAMTGTTAKLAVCAASAISGGVAGSVASAGVTGGAGALFYHQPFFSDSLWVNLGIGVITGAGAGLLEGAHVAFFSVDPRPMQAEDFGSISEASDPGGHDALAGTLRAWVPQRQVDGTLQALTRNGGSVNRIFEVSRRTAADGGPLMADVLAVHGLPGRVVMPTDVSVPNGAGRVMDASTFAEYLRSQGNLGNPNRPLKLLICFGGFGGRFSTAQTIADALGRDVYAYPWYVPATHDGYWMRFQPREIFHQSVAGACFYN